MNEVTFYEEEERLIELVKLRTSTPTIPFAQVPLVYRLVKSVFRFLVLCVNTRLQWRRAGHLRDGFSPGSSSKPHRPAAVE